MPLSDFLKSLNILDPKKVKVLFDEHDDALRIVVDGKVLSGLMPAKPFPITCPEFIIFRDTYGIDLCILKNYKELDEESMRNLKALLDKIYFIPRILKIEKIETSGDEFLWNVLTDKGPRKFKTRGRMSVMQIGNRIVITDMNDNVYEIEDICSLDAGSISEIEMTI